MAGYPVRQLAGYPNPALKIAGYPVSGYPVLVQSAGYPVSGKITIRYIPTFNNVAVQSYLVRCRALVLSFVLNLVLECSLILTAAEQPPSSSVPEK